MAIIPASSLIVALTFVELMKIKIWSSRRIELPSTEEM